MSDVPEVRWLTGPEQEIWRAYMAASVEFAAHVDRQLRRDSGLPMAYYEILVRLSEAPDRSLRMSELAEGSRSSRSRLSHAATRLEERGWLTRFECPTDRRGQGATLADAGCAALEAAAPGHVAAVREHMIDLLSADQIAQLEQISR